MSVLMRSAWQYSPCCAQGLSISSNRTVDGAERGCEGQASSHLIHAPSRKIAEAAANQAQLSRRLHDGELASGEAKREPMLSGNRVFVCYNEYHSTNQQQFSAPCYE
jgi:hypothetical protein